MARQNVTSLRHRVQVAGPETGGRPGLNVEAPLVVNTPAPDTRGWDTLQRALGIAATGLRERRESATAQGLADGMTGRVDEEREEGNGSYADGVHRAAAINQTTTAFREIQELAESEILPGTPLDEAARWVDSAAQQMLGDLLDDPKARLAIASQYTDFMEKFLGEHAEKSRQLHRAEVQTSWETEVIRKLDGAEDIDIVGLVADGAAVFPGGRIEAWQRMVDLAASAAERTGDMGVIGELIPATVDGPGGREHPRDTKVNRDRIEEARANIERQINQQLKPEQQVIRANALETLKGMVHNGELVTSSMTDPLVREGILTAVEAANFIHNSRVAREEEAEAEDAYDQMYAVFQANRGSAVAMIGAPGGPTSVPQAREFSDEILRRELSVRSLESEQAPPLTGYELLHPDSIEDLKYVIGRTRSLQLGYGPLRQMAAGMNPQSPDTVMYVLPLYEQAKLAGVTSHYFSDEQAALSEQALGMQRIGTPPERIADTLRRVNTPEARAYANEHRPNAYKRIESMKHTIDNKWLDKRTRDLGNRPMITARLKQLTEINLGMGMSPEQAADRALERFDETHHGVALNSRTWVIPHQEGLSPPEVTIALEWLADGAAARAAEAGDPDPKGASLRPTFGYQGADLTIQFHDSTDAPLGRPMTIRRVIETMREANPQDFQTLVEKNERSQHRREQGRQYGERFGTAPSGAPIINND